MARKTKQEEEESQTVSKSGPVFKGKWIVNHSPVRQGLRNMSGQNVVLEPGDLMFLLDSEAGMKGVIAKQSHFMNYKGSLIGHHLRFPIAEKGGKMNDVGLKFETGKDMIEYGLHSDMINDATAEAIKKEQAAAAK